jgi:hypothetical protein
MVSKSFDIQTGNLLPFDSASKKLLIEISPELVSVILWDKQKAIPDAVEIFNGSNPDADDWQSMLHQSRLLSFSDLETLIVNAYPEMIPVPVSLYHPTSAKEQLELFFGNKIPVHTGGDVLDKEEMIVAWQLPLDLYEFLKNHFQVFQVKHIASVLLLQQPAGENKAHIVVYGNFAWVLIWLNGQLQIAKPVAFSLPDDLSWHLLNLCRQLTVEPTDIAWEVSGMAEESSPLWQAITRFLDPVKAMNAPVELPENLPAHYFAHLLAAG